MLADNAGSTHEMDAADTSGQREAATANKKNKKEEENKEPPLPRRPTVLIAKDMRQEAEQVWAGRDDVPAAVRQNVLAELAKLGESSWEAEAIAEFGVEAKERGIAGGTDDEERPGGYSEPGGWRRSSSFLAAAAAEDEAAQEQERRRRQQQQQQKKKKKKAKGSEPARRDTVIEAMMEVVRESPMSQQPELSKGIDPNADDAPERRNTMLDALLEMELEDGNIDALELARASAAVKEMVAEEKAGTGAAVVPPELEAAGSSAVAATTVAGQEHLLPEVEIKASEAKASEGVARAVVAGIVDPVGGVGDPEVFAPAGRPVPAFDEVASIDDEDPQNDRLIWLLNFQRNESKAKTLLRYVSQLPGRVQEAYLLLS